MNWKITGARCFIGVAVATIASGIVAADPFPTAALPGTSLNQSIPNYEPSDLVWHSRLRRLFSVSDGSATISSRVFSIADDGTGLAFWPVTGDLEGICVADPASDFLYVGTEQPNQIKEFRISTGFVTRTFDLNPWMSGASGQGLEALTFVPDPGNAEGGTFDAGLQNDGSIYRFSLPILTSATSTAVSLLGSFNPVAGRSDLSGLDYDTAGKLRNQMRLDDAMGVNPVESGIKVLEEAKGRRAAFGIIPAGGSVSQEDKDLINRQIDALRAVEAALLEIRPAVARPAQARNARPGEAALPGALIP